MDDDFNTPRALALIFDEVRALNRLLDEKKTQGIEKRGAALRAMCDTLGLLRDGYFERKKQRFLKKGQFNGSTDRRINPSTRPRALGKELARGRSDP